MSEVKPGELSISIEIEDGQLKVLLAESTNHRHVKRQISSCAIPLIDLRAALDIAEPHDADRRW